MRKISPETELRNLRRELKRVNGNLFEMANASNAYRVRASKAEAEAAEWRKRFDLLLSRVPKLDGEPGRREEER